MWSVFGRMYSQLLLTSTVLMLVYEWHPQYLFRFGASRKQHPLPSHFWKVFQRPRPCSTINSSEAAHLWRPDLKTVAFLKLIISKFTKPVELVVNSCAGICSTAREFMRLPEHHRYVRCCIDSAVVEAEHPAVNITYLTQFLNNGSDITSSDVVLPAVRMYKKSMKRLNPMHFVDK